MMIMGGARRRARGMKHLQQVPLEKPLIVDGRVVGGQPAAASWFVPRRSAGVRKGKVARDVPMQIVFDNGTFYSVESAGTPAEKFVEIKNPSRIAALKRQLRSGRNARL